MREPTGYSAPYINHRTYFVGCKIDIVLLHEDKGLPAEYIGYDNWFDLFDLSFS